MTAADMPAKGPCPRWNLLVALIVLLMCAAWTTGRAGPIEEAGGRWYDCGCFDEPSKHFPYSVVVFKTAKGDLVTRPERREGGLTFSPIALRNGTQYCTIDAEGDCYGSFAHPCDFTDFRFGPTLAEYFPSCKSEDQEHE